MLFSEPKIPQSKALEDTLVTLFVSVLFSEPKIPQLLMTPAAGEYYVCFSALQRAENSSIHPLIGDFQRAVADVSVLFSEPKIPQSPPVWLGRKSQ